MRAEIIAIGDELTSGQRLDTNSQWLAERLLELGVPVAFHTTVGDVLTDNVEVFRRAAERAEIVVASGGLGPTADDLTRHALAQVAGVELVRDDAALAHIKALFARRKREMPPANEIQAMFPRGSRVIDNPHGSAPGIDMTLASGGRKPPDSPTADAHPSGGVRPPLAGDASQASARIFALPGVPAEMKEMWATSVAPAIREHLGITKTICHYRIKCFGVGESDLEAMLPDLIARQRYPLVGITVSNATITLRITAEGETREAALAAMQPTIDTIHKCLGDLIFGYEDDELADAVVRLLRERRQTLVVTEWGTCGLISQWLAETEASDVFRAGTAMTGEMYWNDSNVRSVHGCDYSLIVGPRPQADSHTSAPGNLIVFLVHGNRTIRKEFPFAGHPDILRPRAAKQALNLLRLHLLGKT
ncbi:MAG TPA: molybdopterin-binding protein [Pirellulaceae bacterium]|nr:molybdopterin-binding protein [Pirellulaceae bacterium]